jgi:hypothetical protein
MSLHCLPSCLSSTTSYFFLRYLSSCACVQLEIREETHANLQVDFVIFDNFNPKLECVLTNLGTISSKLNSGKFTWQFLTQKRQNHC